MTNRTATASVTMALASEKGVPDWVQLFPAGPTITARDGRVWKLTNPDAVIAAFDADEGPIAIDYEHGMGLEAEVGQPVPAAGWIDKLENRGGEIWAHVEWTERAAAMITAREYRFISPEFRVTEADSEIVAIEGAGLVNRPAMRMTALARRNDNLTPVQENTMSNAINRALCKRLGLADGACEETIIAAIDKRDEDHKTELAAAKADLDTFVPRADYDKVKTELAKANETIKDSETAAKEAEITAAVDKAVTAGKIAPASRDQYLDLCRAEDGLAKFNKLVDTMPVIAKQSGLDGPADDPAGGLEGDPIAEAETLAARARVYQSAQADLGVHITTSEAVDAVQADAKKGAAA